jgi:class 3 adenylate cyclase
MTACSSCSSEQPEGARFCNSCGAAMAAPVCSSCGQQLVPGSRFCNSCGAPQQETAAASAGPVAPARGGQPVAARRVTSVLFGDLVGFTSLSESRDQEEVRELLSRYFDQCRQIIGRYGGTVEKFIGDAVMAVWGVPTAHEDDAERSVRAGLELVNALTAMGEDLGVPGLAMRVGIVTGEVAVTIGAEAQGMVAGDAVNTASRVQSVAAPGQVWVDETTRLLTSSAITYVDVGSHALKGKAEPVPLWAVRAVVAARGGAQRADGLEAPLVGRDRELRLVKELFHAVEEGGRPGLVVVDGDAGVGKSRLAWEYEKYVDGLSTDVRWHSGRCVAYGEGVAFYALAEAVRGRLSTALPEADDDRDVEPERLLDAGLDRYVTDAEERAWIKPRLGALLGIGTVGTFDREDLFGAWTTFLDRVGAGEQTLVMVVEDAQHADEGLLAFLEYLLTVGSFPCFVMLLSRPGLLEAHPSLATNRQSTIVHLPTLSDADMSQLLGGLVAGLPDDVRASLVRRADGVPLFAVETVRSLIDRDLVVPRGGQYVLADPDRLDLDTIGAPASLQALISARLDTLTAQQRRVVDAGSVLGESFHRDEIAALCPQSADLDHVLGELVRLQILGRQSSRLSSEFGQYRFVQTAVRQVAYGTLSRRDRKAMHLAAVELLLSDEDAGEDLAPMVAQHYLDALEAMPADPDAAALQERAIAQLERAARRAESLGAPGEAAGHLATALANASEESTCARLRSELAWALLHSGRYDDAARHASTATAEFQALGEPVSAGVAAAAHAQALALGLGDNEAGIAVAEPWWDRLNGHPEGDAALLALSESLITCKLRMSQDIRDLNEARVRLAERLGKVDALADAYSSLGVHYATQGLISFSLVLLDAAADMARKQHRPSALARALLNQTAFLNADDVAQAVDRGREALAAAYTSGAAIWISFAQVNLALAFIERGLWEELEQALAGDIDVTEKTNEQCFAALALELKLARGEPWSLPWSVGARPAGDDYASEGWQDYCEALAARADGRTGEALAHVMAALEKMFAFSGTWDDLPHFWSAAVDLTVETGDRAARDRLLELADDSQTRIPVSLKGHRHRLEALWTDRHGGDPSDVERGLRDALEAYDAWGSVVHLARARAELGVWLTGQGRAAEAAPLVEQARATFTELGATAWLAELDDRLAAPLPTGSGSGS